MKAPGTYAEWVDILDILEAGTDDADALAAMQSGTLSWQSGVAERFSSRLIAVVNSRLDRASKRFDTAFQRAGGYEGAIVQALLGQRRELAFLAKVMDLPVIPDDIRRQYAELIRNYADEYQESLESGAKDIDRSGRIYNIVKNHKVNAF